MEQRILEVKENNVNAVVSSVQIELLKLSEKDFSSACEQLEIFIEQKNAERNSLNIDQHHEASYTYVSHDFVETKLNELR